MAIEPQTDSGEDVATVFFCLRADSDVDHIVPVVDALARRRRQKIRMIVYDPIKTFRSDYRLQYLHREYGLMVEHQMELAGIPRGDRIRSSVLRRTFHVLLILQRRSPLQWLARSLRPVLMRIGRRLKGLGDSEAAIAAVVSEVESCRHGVVVFDHTINPLAEAVTAAARRRSLETVALPHSIPHLSDLPRDAVIATDSERGLDWGALYDRVILPNAATADRFAAQSCGTVPLLVLGSARFSRSWGDILDSITPRFEWNPGGTKVLFILSKKGPYVDWPEVDRVTARLCRDPRLAVILKPHPRTETSGLPAVDASRRVAIASAEIPTSSLIQWADLIVFWGSSVIYDALRLKKPVLHLAYLFQLHFDFEPFMQSWRVRNFEEFSQRLDDFVERGGPIYGEAEVATCMDALVEPAGEAAPDRYADFVAALLENPAVDRIVAARQASSCVNRKSAP